MFREWREVTKSILKNPDRTLNHRYELTNRYITFVKVVLKKDPKLFAEYLENKGIIRVRNMFLLHAGLDYKGLCSSDLALPDLARLKLDEDVIQTLIIPIAPPISGKSRLGNALARIMPSFEAVAFDGMSGTLKKRAKKWLGCVLASGEAYVYADRHNHRKEQRDELIASFMGACGSGECNIVVVAWDVGGDLKEISRILSTRVEGRKRHPTLHAKTKDFERNVASIVHSLETWVEADEDKDIVTVRVGIDYEFEQIVKRVLVACEVDFDDADTMKALAEVEKEYLVYQDSEEAPVEAAKVVVKSVKKERSIRYIGIVLDESSRDDLKNAIISQLEKDRSDAVAFYESLQSTGRGLHVTLALNPNISTEPKNTRLFKKYVDKINADIEAILNVQVTAKEVVWNGRIMCVTVDCGGVECCNDEPHCTVGVVGDAKGSESNVLLREGGGDGMISLGCPVVIKGKIQAVKY
jgi:tRNA splicing ligase